MIIAFFGPGYALTLQDLQILMDVSPLRIDSVLVREPREEDFASPECPAQLAVDGPSIPPSSAAKKSAAMQSVASAAPVSALIKAARAALCITVLDANQPVQITESEVVRIRKRSRGLFSLGSLLGFGS